MAPKRATRSTPVTTTPAPTVTTTTSVTNAQLQAMIDQRITAALAARDVNRNGDDSHTSGIGGRRTERIVRECTYQDFMKCKPLYFKGTEGVVELIQCHDVAYAMTWADLRKKMTDKYCPMNEMKKLEAELWNLKVKGTDVIGYNQRFQELALLCVRMFPEESDKIERYVGGLPDMIHGNIVASKPKTMQEAVEMATELMDKKVITIAERQAENKRKFENTSRNNQNQQQQNKRQNTGRAYTAGTGERKPYGGSKPLCAKCNYHHDGCGISMPIMHILTNRGALGQARNLLVAIEVEFKDTSMGNASKAGKNNKNVEIRSCPRSFGTRRTGFRRTIILQDTKFDEEERAQVARDEEIARQLLALDEERVTIDPMTTKDIDWNDPSIQSNYKMKDFDGMSYDEKKKPDEFQVEQIEKDTTGKRKKSLHRKRTRSTTKRQKVELDDEKEDLKGYLDIVPRDEVDEDVDSPLYTEYPYGLEDYTLSETSCTTKSSRGDGAQRTIKIFE
ncbi:reverse transcriptase domain-containing protein [Tanacetum coccineum]